VHFPIRKGLLFDRVVGHVKAVDGVDLRIPAGAPWDWSASPAAARARSARRCCRSEEPTAGAVVYDGTDVAGLEGEELRGIRRHMQMVFQDPMASLNPRQSVERILTEPLDAHGITYDSGRVQELLELVGLPSSAARRFPARVLRRPAPAHRHRPRRRARAVPGDRRRAGVALDVSIQAQVLNLLSDLQEQLGLTYLVIAHDLAVVRHVSDEVAVMYLGAIVEQADSHELYVRPGHPYTKALMSAVPVPDPEVEDHRERILLTGDLPSPANPPSGCRFHTRCPFRQPTRCDDERPALLELRPGHRVACHWVREIEAGQIAPNETAATDTQAPAPA
jgi:peptide/nickel transport system ATP-binding protein